jgi:hypothetical protein
VRMECRLPLLQASLHSAAGIADVDQAHIHDVQLLQGVRMLRVLDVSNVLQTRVVMHTHSCTPVTIDGCQEVLC